MDSPLAPPADPTVDPLPARLADIRALLRAGRIEPARQALAALEGSADWPARACHAVAAAWDQAGVPEEAAARHLRAIAVALREPDIVAAREAIVARDFARAEAALRARMTRERGDAAATWLLADLAARAGRHDAAGRLLGHVTGLAPGFLPARRDLAFALYRQSRHAEALGEVERVLAQAPDDAPARDLKASLLLQTGEYEAGIALYRAMLAERPDRPKLWISLGDALKTVGRIDEAVAAYRESAARDPADGAAWWSLANLKTFRFGEADMAALRHGAADASLSEDQRLHFEFALGKALEDAGDDAAAFTCYLAANARRRRLVPHDPEALTAIAGRSEGLYTPAFFAARPGGHPSPEPIFVLGMPRSGSTLVEQILASHPLIEGTRELPYLPAIARALDRRDGEYPEMIGALDPARRHALGADYLDRAALHRKSGRPYFIDKLPNNFMHLGLIQLILPNARIIDVRRHPMASGFACFKQHFAHGQEFAYDLAELGRYYADYVRIAAAFDAALPGRVHRIHYERLVADTEAEVRALLGYLGLPFDPACLAFHSNARAVRTPSAEQVRQPIFTDAVDRWRRFAPWLTPLAEALGPALPPAAADQE